MIIVEFFRYTWCSFFNNKKTSFTQFNRILTRNSVCSVYRLTRIVYYSPGGSARGPIMVVHSCLFHLGVRIFHVHQQNICIVFCRLCQHQCSIIQQHNGIPWKIVFFFYTCWFMHVGHWSVLQVLLFCTVASLYKHTRAQTRTLTPTVTSTKRGYSEIIKYLYETNWNRLSTRLVVRNAMSNGRKRRH